MVLDDPFLLVFLFCNTLCILLRLFMITLKALGLLGLFEISKMLFGIN